MTTPTLTRLQNIKLLATLLLLLNAVLFAIATVYQTTHPLFPWLRAFAEAATVAALADWFAVTALFRRPLGLPIPHTGIIPRNQARIANTLGRFIYENFLNPETLSPKLKEARLAETFAAWLNVPENSALIARQIKDFLFNTLRSLKKEETAGFLKQVLPTLASKLPLGPLLAEMLTAFKGSDKDGKLFDEIITAVEKLLTQHQTFLRDILSSDLPWYIPSFVKHHLYSQVMGSITKTMGAMRTNPDHILRQQLGFALTTGIQKLREDPALEARLQKAVTEVFNNEPLLEYLQQMSTTALAGLGTDENQLFQKTISTLLSHAAHAALENPSFSAQADEIAATFILRLVKDYGTSAGDFIETTITGWDASHLVSKIEMEVGRDLQFIRINGTIVGGLVGLALHLLSRTLNF